MRAKSTTRIRLANGDVMTLREAIEAKRVAIILWKSWSKRLDRHVDRKYAREPGSDELWDVSDKQRLTCVQCWRPVPAERECYASPTCLECLPAPPAIPSTSIERK